MYAVARASARDNIIQSTPLAYPGKTVGLLVIDVDENEERSHGEHPGTVWRSSPNRYCITKKAPKIMTASSTEAGQVRHDEDVQNAGKGDAPAPGEEQQRPVGLGNHGDDQRKDARHHGKERVSRGIDVDPQEERQPQGDEDPDDGPNRSGSMDSRRCVAPVPRCGCRLPACRPYPSDIRDAVVQ